jgi:hypothetical protein
MLHSIEHAVAIGAGIWAVVQLIKHFAPDFYSREELNFYTKFKDAATKLEARVAELEKKLEGK